MLKQQQLIELINDLCNQIAKNESKIDSKLSVNLINEILSNKETDTKIKANLIDQVLDLTLFEDKNTIKLALIKYCCISSNSVDFGFKNKIKDFNPYSWIPKLEFIISDGVIDGKGPNISVFLMTGVHESFGTFCIPIIYRGEGDINNIIMSILVARSYLLEKLALNNLIDECMIYMAIDVLRKELKRKTNLSFKEEAVYNIAKEIFKMDFKSYCLALINFEKGE